MLKKYKWNIFCFILFFKSHGYGKRKIDKKINSQPLSLFKKIKWNLFFFVANDYWNEDMGVDYLSVSSICELKYNKVHTLYTCVKTKCVIMHLHQIHTFICYVSMFLG